MQNESNDFIETFDWALKNRVAVEAYNPDLAKFVELLEVKIKEKLVMPVKPIEETRLAIKLE